MNRAVAAASYRIHVASANLWRDAYNPLRSLTIQRAVSLLEEGERGAMADLQWTYRFIEMQDPVLGALVERRTSAIQELDWRIAIKTEIPAGKELIAERQAEALQAAYQKIGNLTESFEDMQMASFRGFARLEKVTDENGDIIELAHVDQWFWVRQGLYGAWQLNRDSSIGTNRGEDVPDARFVTREVKRPINRVALIAFIRKSLSQKDWDAFIEAYGIPAVFIIMPDTVPEGKEDEYMEMADQVSSDARGVLPKGSDVKTVDNGARGVNPFKDHIAYQDEMVVLRGTGGKLTMLAESGSGTLAGNAHADTFAQIARAEAREISEIYRKCIDAEIIERVTPGETAYAYFELAANEETDPGQVVKDLGELKKAGYTVDAKFVEEKTGYPVLVQASPVTPPLKNRMILNYNPDQRRDPKGVQTGGRWTKDFMTGVDPERDAKKSVKDSILKNPSGFLPLNTPRGVLEEMENWEVVSKSPYSASLYDITNKSWGPDPDGFRRLADHWNYTSQDQVHGETDLIVPDGCWALAEKQAGDAPYKVLKVWERTVDVDRLRADVGRAERTKLTPAREALLLSMESGPVTLSPKQAKTFDSWHRADQGWGPFIETVAIRHTDKESIVTLGLKPLGKAVVNGGKIDLSRAKTVLEGIEDFPNAREIDLATLQKNTPAQTAIANRNMTGVRETSASGVESRQSEASSRWRLDILNRPMSTHETDEKDAVAASIADLRKRLAADMKPLGDALQAAFETEDFAAMTAALRKISQGMPDFMASDELAGGLANLMADWLTTAEPTPSDE